jgi:hypothetical protein
MLIGRQYFSSHQYRQRIATIFFLPSSPYFPQLLRVLILILISYLPPSELALEIAVRDMEREEDEDDDDEEYSSADEEQDRRAGRPPPPAVAAARARRNSMKKQRETSSAGLWLNLFITFLYQCSKFNFDRNMICVCLSVGAFSLSHAMSHV